MTTVTLITGEQVDSKSQELLNECRTRWLHVQSMRSMGLPERRMYLETVARKEGQEASRRLAEKFREDWEARRAQKENA